MDELDNDALSLLLILDDDLFPQLLEWSASKGWSDLVIFLLETDYFRFKTNDLFEELEVTKPSLYEAYYLIEKNSGGCFDKFFTEVQLASLKRLLDSGIPLNTVYSYTCSMVWKEMLERVKDIIDSPFWPSVRRSIVEKHEITLEEMLEDSSKRVFFDRYIQGEASDLSTLQCLLSTRRILKAVNRFKLSNDGTIPSLPNTPVVLGMKQPNTGTTGSHFFSYFTGQYSDDNNSSIMRRWRVSKNAVSSASKALQAPFATTSTSSHTHTTSTSSPNPQTHDYSDPFEVFRILLEGTRQLQKQFFPNSTSVILSSVTNSAFVTYSGGNAATTAMHNANRIRRYSGTDTSSDAGSVASSPHNSNTRSHQQHTHQQQQQQYYTGSTGQQRNCSGISEALRIEIQSTLTINASVRTREIETVDRAFAFACANMFEKLLLSLEAEMLAYIQNIFQEYESTTTYALMVAHARALKCKRIVDYAVKLEFLYDRVRQQKIVSWKDSHTRGKVFLAYGKLSAEGDEDCSAARRLSNANTTSTAGTAAHARIRTNSYASSSGAAERKEENLEDDHMSTTAPYRPNIVAISLEIVLPHTTMLTPANVVGCPHRVCLYAGGKRRAARIRPTLKTPTPSSCALIPPRGSKRVLPTTLEEGIGHEDPYTSAGIEPPLPTDSLPALNTTVSPTSFPPALETFATVSSLSTKSPIRRMSSVKFTFDEVQTIKEEKREAAAIGSSPTSFIPPPPNTNIMATKSIEDSDSENEEDLVSELPVRSIASSVQGRTILNTNEIGRGGNCFDDIVNSDSCNLNNNVEEEAEEEEDRLCLEVEDLSDSSSSDSNDSDSSSDYEGVVRHVYSNTDLDQLMRNSPMAEDFDQESAVLEDGERSARFRKSRSQRGSSRKLRSRAGSDVSSYTAVSGATSYTRQSSHASSNPRVHNTAANSINGETVHRMAEIDLSRLDRTLQRVVLGGYVPSSSSGAGGLGQSRVARNKKVTTKQLVASLAVALAAVRDDEEQFGRKFGVSVEESFTFTTDTKGLGQLNDMLYSKQPGSISREQIAGYLKSYETAASVFRQNSMLDTTRPLYRVSVQIQSAVITPAEASQLKQQLSALEESGRSIPSAVSVSGTSKTNLHGAQTPKKVVVSPGSRIMHSHVCISVSYVLVSSQHTMVTTLEAVAGAAACTTMQSTSLGSCGSLDSATDHGAQENAPVACDQLRPFPRHLHYCNPFGEYASRTGASLSGKGGESLYELYLGTHPGYHLQGSAKTAASPLERTKGDDQDTAPPLCEPISRHIGICDFSLSTMIATVSPRLILQILMLVLVDRPIMLISTSSTLLSQLQAALPRLIWPFRIENTHVIRQLLSPAELHHFVYRHDVPFVTETQQPVIREKKLNRKTSSWREIITRIASNVGSTFKNVASGGGGSGGSVSGESTMPIGMRSPRGSFSNPNRQRKSGSSGDLLSEVLRRTASATIVEEERKSNCNSPVHLHVDIPGYSGKLTEPAPRSPYTRIVTPPSLQLPSNTPSTTLLNEERGEEERGHVVDQFSCIVGVDANAFYTAALELREELETMRIRGSGFTFIDIDSGLILNRHPDDFGSEDEGDNPPRPLPSRLSDCELFRTTDCGILRSLLKSLTSINYDLTSFAESLLLPTSTTTMQDGYGEEEDVVSINNENIGNMFDPIVDNSSLLITEKIVESNREVEKTFYSFWAELLLRALPNNIHYFPGPKIISCNIRGMLTELLYTVVASSVLYDMGEDYEDLLATFRDKYHENNWNTTTGKSTEQRKGNTNINTPSPTTGMNKERTYLEWNELNQLPPILIPNHILMHDHMRKMPFEEFLALFIEEIANHGETNLCYAFYKEFIADGSVVFKNLLLRHSEILEKWRM